MPYIIGGAMLGSAALGSKGAKNAAKNPAADIQAQLAQQLFQETDPLRRGLIGRSERFIGAPGPGAAGGMVPGVPGQTGTTGFGRFAAVRQGPFGIPMQGGPIQGGVGAPAGRTQPDLVGELMSTPSFLAMKDAADRNFGRARSGAISSLPQGGALIDALVGLEGQRAGTLTQGAGQLYENELARALSLATGTTPTALSALGQAGFSQGQSAQAAAALNAATMSQFGEGAGTLAAQMGSKKGTTGGVT